MRTFVVLLVVLAFSACSSAPVPPGEFISSVRGAARKHFSLPASLLGKDLRSEIGVKFDGAGRITSVLLKKSSGNQVFDDVALKAIREMGSLPEPPSELVDKELTLLITGA